MDGRLRAALATIACAMAIGLVSAQSVPGVPPDNQLNPGRAKAGGGSFIVIGCVSREGQGTSQAYVITEMRHAKPVQYRLEGNQDLFRVHVGHTVEVGGPLTPPATGSTPPSLKVQSLTYLSTTCVKPRQ